MVIDSEILWFDDILRSASRLSACTEDPDPAS